MNNNNVFKGAFLGAVTGIAIAVTLVSLVLFAAVRRSTDSAIAGIATAHYTSGARGGFDVSVQPESGVLALVGVCTLIGAALALTRTRRQQGAQP